jgi:nicotinate-nucleotide pyrophosphorylase (carboxylating)
MSADWLTSQPQILELVELGLKEDIGTGDVSCLSSLSPQANGAAIMWLKQDAMIAGLPMAELVFKKVDPELKITFYHHDGNFLEKGTKLLMVEGKAASILSAERLVLNFVQRLSGVATLSKKYADLAKPFKTKILDTRKTTPGHRILEKYAVRVGGCHNHRMGLYDMVMLKDNHIDFCGGITNAINKTKQYLTKHKLELKIEVETRNLDEVKEVCDEGGVDRIMLDNFSPSQIIEALKIIEGRFEAEASGGIHEENILSYLQTNIDYISIGALTHSPKSIDISLKTEVFA